MSNNKLKLETYDQNPNGIDIISITVASDHDKEQLLAALKYLHDLRNINTDFVAVNGLVHMYQVPERIIVKKEKEHCEIPEPPSPVVWSH